MWIVNINLFAFEVSNGEEKEKTKIIFHVLLHFEWWRVHALLFQLLITRKNKSNPCTWKCLNQHIQFIWNEKPNELKRNAWRSFLSHIPCKFIQNTHTHKGIEKFFGWQHQIIYTIYALATQKYHRNQYKSCPVLSITKYLLLKLHGKSK